MSFTIDVPTKQANFLSLVTILSNRRTSTSLFKYLDDQTIQSMKVCSKFLYQTTNFFAIKHFVKSNKVNDSNRISIWKHLLNLSRKESQLKAQFNLPDGSDVFEYLYQKGQDIADGRNRDSRFVQCYSIILKDCCRTFYFDKFAKEEGQDNLRRVLMTIALTRPEIGYCQGMNFVSGALIHFLQSESDAFLAFLVLLDDYQVCTLYYNNIMDFSIRAFQLEYYFERELPALFRYLQKEGIRTELFTTKWIMTLFSAFVNLDMMKYIFDYFMVDGWKAIFKFSVIILKQMQKKFMNSDISGISTMLQTSNGVFNIDREVIWKEYSSMKIRNRELKSLKEKHFIKLTLEKLEVFL